MQEGEYAYFGCPASKDAKTVKSQDEDMGNGKAPANSKFKNLVTGAEESRDGNVRHRACACCCPLSENCPPPPPPLPSRLHAKTSP